MSVFTDIQLLTTSNQSFDEKVVDLNIIAHAIATSVAQNIHSDFQIVGDVNALVNALSDQQTVSMTALERCRTIASAFFPLQKNQNDGKKLKRAISVLLSLTH